MSVTLAIANRSPTDHNSITALPNLHARDRAWLSLQDVGLLFSPWLVLTTILNETRDVTGIFAAAFTPTRTNT